MAKGDYIIVTYRTPSGFAVARTDARVAGRQVQIDSEKELNLGWINVKEVTRGGTVVMERRFLASEVLAIEIEKKEME